MKTNRTLIIAAMTVMCFYNVHVNAQPNRPSPCDLKSDMRKLWEDHITWTRNVIFCFLDSLPGKTEAVTRLLQNQDDIGNAIKPYYGVAAGNALTSLLYGHILTAADVLVALHTNNTPALNAAVAAWYANADSIAVFLSTANPYLPLADMTQMMHEHLDLTTQEAVARHTMNYAADVAAYDAVHLEILEMSDMISAAIVRQFRNMFAGPSARPSMDVELGNEAIALSQNFPNPFEEKTVVNYYIPIDVADAQIRFIDLMGNVIKTVNIQTRGEGSLNISASNLRKGVYTYSIVADGRVIESKQMIH
jgi:hypothetical protein